MRLLSRTPVLASSSGKITSLFESDFVFLRSQTPLWNYRSLFLKIPTSYAVAHS